MEPATKSDLQDLIKELRDNIKDSIKEAIAEGFGNWKQALAHATTPVASQVLAIGTISDEPIPAMTPASLSATVDILPEPELAASAASAKSLNIDATGVAAPTPTSCLTDGLNHIADGNDHMVGWQTAWSTPTSFTVPPAESPIPSGEPALGHALGALAQTKCSTEGSKTSANSIVLASMSGAASEKEELSY